MEIHPIVLTLGVRAAWTADGTPEALATALEAPNSLFPKQIHGNRVEWADGLAGAGIEADGLLTEVPGLLVGVRTADCLPILVAHRAKSFIGAVHAGRRGLANGILDVLAERIAESGKRLADCAIFLGPAIGPCCYSVGAEVGERFGRHFDGKALDLKDFARERLEALGAQTQAIFEEPACTRCTAGLPSYRRDPSCGRILTGIVLQYDNGCHP